MSEKSAAGPAYIESDEAVSSFLSGLGRVSRLGLDTEGASFHRFVDRIYLIQLSTDRQHAIIDPLAITAPAGLGALLEDPAVEVVFHDADYDLRLLRQDYGWQARNVFDTRVAAQLLGITAFGLAALLERYFGVKLDKKHQRADWSMRPLTAGMLEYAAQDTLYLLDLRDRLADELRRRERWAWAAEEFARLADVHWEPAEPEGAFLRIKGARDLTRRELALLRELVQWRDALARTLDKATFRVAGNEVLIEASRLAPRSRDVLGTIKGMPRGIVERQGGEVLAAIERGLAVPDGDLPKFPRGKRYARDPEFDAKVGALKAVRDAVAKRLELDPGVLCSRDRLEAVVRALPREMDAFAGITELRKWQVAELGAGFIEALRPYSAVPASANQPDQNPR